MKRLFSPRVGFWASMVCALIWIIGGMCYTFHWQGAVVGAIMLAMAWLYAIWDRTEG